MPRGELNVEVTALDFGCKCLGYTRCYLYSFIGSPEEAGGLSAKKEAPAVTAAYPSAGYPAVGYSGTQTAGYAPSQSGGFATTQPCAAGYPAQPPQNYSSSQPIPAYAAGQAHASFQGAAYQGAPYQGSQTFQTPGANQSFQGYPPTQTPNYYQPGAYAQTTQPYAASYAPAGGYGQANYAQYNQYNQQYNQYYGQTQYPPGGY